MSIRVKSFVTGAGLLCEVIFQLVGAAPALASKCSFSEIARHYKSGLQFAASELPSDSFAKLLILAEAGFSPAQREVSKSIEGGRGAERSPYKAALWAELAFRSGDMEGRNLSLTYRAALTDDQRQRVNAAAEAWTARAVKCPGGRVTFHGHASSLNTPLIVKIGFNKLIKPEDRPPIKARINNMLDQALRSEPSARLYLGMIDEIEIYHGSRYHRYVGWRKNSKRNVLRFASSNLEDTQLDFMAKALVVEAKRRAFSLMPDAEYLDPHMRRFNGKYFFGSAYPDINNERFFKLMRQAFTMIKRLPGDIRAYVEAINEIHYNPHSQHFVRYGVADSSGAYYNKNLSSDALSLIFVRRDALYSSPLFFVRILVHEGTHAIQDRRAKAYLAEIPRIKLKLNNLEKFKRKNTPGYHNLKKQIEVRLDYARRWFRGIKTQNGKWAQDINFECEATINEIKALKALNASPRALDDSGYVRICPSAKRLIDSWKSSVSGKKR